MQELVVGSLRLQLLPQWAMYIEAMRSLLVADVHLVKPATFQAHGVQYQAKSSCAQPGNLNNFGSWVICIIGLRLQCHWLGRQRSPTDMMAITLLP